MPLYEHVFLARQDISAQQVETMVETFQSIIKDGGGSIGKSEYWGLKGLAYKIKKNRKAHFSLFNIEGPHAAVAEMERQMGLSTDVIRFLTLRVDEHDNEPSATMKRGDRDDRRGGGRHRDGDRGGRDRDRRPPRDDRPPREERKPPIAETTAKSGDSSSSDADTKSISDGGDK